MPRGIAHNPTEKARKLSAAHRGVPLSYEHRQKIGHAHRGMKRSLETCARIALSKIGRPRSPDVIQKMRRTMFSKGLIPHNKGKSWQQWMTESGIAAIREANTGANSFLWKGGIASGTNRKPYRTMKAAQRKAILLALPEHFSIQEWIALKSKYQSTCLSCNKTEPDIALTPDHIVPLARGGTNTIDNIQPLCRSCNSSKNVKTIDFRERSSIAYFIK